MLTPPSPTQTPEQSLEGPAPVRAAKPTVSLGQLLLGAELITAEELETALARQSKTQTKLGETLIELGFVGEDQILPFIQRQLNLPTTRLRDGLVDPQVIRLLPRERAEALHGAGHVPGARHADRGHGRAAEPAADRRDRTDHAAARCGRSSPCGRRSSG